MGSGSLTPSGLFEKAHSICMREMSLPKPATSGLTATQINNTLRGYVSKLKSSSCQASEDSLKNYYVKGEVKVVFITVKCIWNNTVDIWL